MSVPDKCDRNPNARESMGAVIAAYHCWHMAAYSTVKTEHCCWCNVSRQVHGPFHGECIESAYR